jgi:hypothetical protein
MGQYSVPQNVEADDKLLGPFSFRQFIYLFVVAGCVALAWLLGTIFVGLAIIPLPVILLFGALALPLKKDQPMETYLLAIISFILKPKKRIWAADGIESLIEVTAPKVVEVQYTKDLSEDEASKRIAYLSGLADTQGWAIKTGNDSSPMRDDLYQEAMDTTDILDENSQTAANLSQKLDTTDQQRRDDVIKNMRESFAKEDANTGINAATTPVVTPVAAAPTPTVPPTPVELSPPPEPPAPIIPDEPSQPAPEAVTIDPNLVNLSNNNDLTVDTIAREAKRITKKDNSKDEVFVSLR